MMRNILVFGLMILMVSCNKKKENNTVRNNSADYTENYNSVCAFTDGTYPATINYSNENTGHTATYTLDVEVEDCQVIQINFENGGHLDEDHITAGAIDSDGNATVEGEDGKSYEIEIYN